MGELFCYRFFDKTTWDIFFVRAYNKGEAICIADYFRIYPYEFCGVTAYENALLSRCTIYEKPLTVDW